MKSVIAHTYFPLFHWVFTLILGPLVDGLLHDDSKIVASTDIYLTVLISSAITGVPALIVYFLIYRYFRNKFRSNWELKLFMVIIAAVLMLATLEIYASMSRDYGPAYGIAIWITSLFLPVGIKKTKTYH